MLQEITQCSVPNNLSKQQAKTQSMPTQGTTYCCHQQSRLMISQTRYSKHLPQEAALTCVNALARATEVEPP